MKQLLGCNDVPAFILAGGESRRFGSNKARALHDGLPLIVRISELLTPHFESTTVVGRSDGQYHDLGLETIGDRVRARGPIGGLQTALAEHKENRWIFVTACDWVGLRVEWIGILAKARDPDAQAVVFKHERYEPLLGFYQTSIRDVVVRRVAAGDLAMHALLDSLRTICVTPPPGWSEVQNLNQS